MNTSRKLVAAAALIAAGGAFTVASARDLSTSAEIVRSTVAGHAYQNGGVSQEQVIDMERHSLPYDLRLTFSEGKHNVYAADLKLRIIDAAGKEAFALEEAGPLTDVSLPAGHYRVVAEFGGVSRSGAVVVKPGEATSLNLHWPRDET